MVFEVVEHTKLYISTKKIVIGGGEHPPHQPNFYLYPTVGNCEAESE